jgi:serine/threonine-protein kinase
VKPGNVMLSPDGTVRLLDFGLAIPIDAIRVNSNSTRGTVAYMSPQQARGEPIDARSDLWSLGVVLYEMIAGSRPFNRRNSAPILEQIFHSDPEPLSAYRQEIPAALSRITALERPCSCPRNRCARFRVDRISFVDAYRGNETALYGPFNNAERRSVRTLLTEHGPAAHPHRQWSADRTRPC